MSAETYSEYHKKQMATLQDHDHQLFTDILLGLEVQGWAHQGGNKQTLWLMDKPDGSSIRIYRKAEVPELIYIRYSAEPEPK